MTSISNPNLNNSSPSVKKRSARAVSGRGRKKLSGQKLLPILKMLKNVKPVSARKELLKHFDDETSEGLYEMIHNVLYSNKLTEGRKNKLRKALTPYKSNLKYIAREKGSGSVKKQKMAEMGAFPFTAILSAAIPLLTSLLFKKKGAGVKKKKNANLQTNAASA